MSEARPVDDAETREGSTARSRMLARLTPPLLLLSALGVSLRPGLENDAWWHLASGRWMLEHRAWLSVDVFSWTRLGTAWPRPGLVADVGMAWLHDAGGIRALVLGAALCVVAAIGITLAHTRAAPLPTLGVGVVTVLALTVAATPRPLVLSLPLTAAVVAILAREHRAPGGSGWLWTLPVLAMVWVNVHGAFVVLFLLLGCHGVGVLVDAVMDRRRRSGDSGHGRRLVRLVVAAVLSVAAVGVNPFGWSMLLYPFETLGLSVLGEAVDEWSRPSPTDLRTWPLYGLLMLAVLALVRGRRRIGGTELVPLLVFGVMAMTSIRHGPLFALVAFPVVVRSLAEPGGADFLAAWRVAAPYERRIEAGLLVMIAATVAVVTAPAWTLSGNERAVAAFHGDVAAQRAAAGDTVGRLWNSYDLGGYVIWHGTPDVLVSIDSRTDLHGDDAVREHLREWSGRRAVPPRFAEEGIASVLIERHAPLVEHLEADGWRRVAEDRTAILLHAPGESG